MSLDGTRCAPLLVLLTILIVPFDARATNGATPRTPALYPPHACLTQIDRSVSTLLHFDVTIPFEDVSLTEDELVDSRTFQFFALCRDDHRLVDLPNWITVDDAMRALEAGLVPELPSGEDVLAGHPRWMPGHDGAPDSCVQIIGTERMPISCAATGDGVGWDTRAVPAGNYVIRGYTFAPAINLWTKRLGVVQIGDHAELEPVVALTSPVYEPKAYQQSGFRVLGCMGGPAGTMVTLSWAVTSDEALDDDAAWTPFADLDASQGEIDELLVPPESAIYSGLLVRGVARAPDGRSWTGYAPGFITVYPGGDASDEPELSPGPDYCDVGGDTSRGPTGGSSSGSSGESSATRGQSETTGNDVEQSATTDGCGCVVSEQRPRSWLLVILLGLCAPTRRRARDRGKASRRGGARATTGQSWPSSCSSW